MFMGGVFLPRIKEPSRRLAFPGERISGWPQSYDGVKKPELLDARFYEALDVGGFLRTYDDFPAGKAFL